MNNDLRRLLIFAVIAVFAACCFVVGIGAGNLLCTLEKYKAQTDKEIAAIQPLLQDDPAYAAVEIKHRFSGGIFLTGTLPKYVDYERLRAKIALLYGTERAEEIVRGTDSALR